MQSSSFEQTANFKDLLAWQKAMDFVGDIYQLTDNLPKEEVYSLSSQLRNAAVKIPAKIAEGTSRQEVSEYVFSLQAAQGGLAELETLLLVVKKLNFVDSMLINPLLESLHRLATIVHDLEVKLLEGKSAAKIIPLKPNLRILHTEMSDHA